MFGGIGNFDRIVYFSLGMIRVVKFPSSFRFSSSSIFTLIKSSILVLVSWFLEAIVRVVSYFSAIITRSFLSASFFLLGSYFVILRCVIGRALVMSLVVVPGFFGFWWDYGI